jgi:hypothetical protein
MSLGLLQLTALPTVGSSTSAVLHSADKIALAAEEKSYFSSKWPIQGRQAGICAVMLLTAEGLNTGSYYYALKSLFQQNYNNFKVVIVDNTPALGLEA